MTTPSEPASFSPSSRVATTPVSNGDGTRTAVVAGPLRRYGRGHLLPVHLPAGLAQEGVSARFFLARCGPNSGAPTVAERATSWEIYLRRPLYAAMHHPLLSSALNENRSIEPATLARWDLFLPDTDDPGYRWLASQPEGAPINLLGPFGNGYKVQPQSRNLLLLTNSTLLPILLGLCDEMLDRGGRVTLVLRLQPGEQGTDLRAQLPIPVEVRPAANAEQWQSALAETIRWADQIAVALPPSALPALGQAIAQHRFRFDQDFAHALVQADLLCGFGACLACVVPTKEGGYTRACVHGPVFDLKTLV